MTIVDILNVDYPFIEITFSNGKSARINLSRPVVKRLLSDKKNFETVKLESGGLTWFDVTFDPDEFYEYSQEHTRTAGALYPSLITRVLSKIVNR